jgi:hypothetical protein
VSVLAAFIARLFGVSPERAWSGLAWAAFAGACLGSAAVAGVLVHAYARNAHAAEIAAITAAHQTALATRAAQVLTLEREAAAHVAVLEDAYVQMAEDRADAGAEIARLSADLHTVTGSLRKSASRGGGGSLPAAAPAASGCADLRAANARLADALDRLVEGGAGIVADGQRAVDVATLAGQAARQRAKGE